MAERFRGGVVTPQSSSNAEHLTDASVDDSQALLAHESLSEEGTGKMRVLLHAHHSHSLIEATGVVDAPQTISRWSRFKQHPVMQFLCSWWRGIVLFLPPLLLLPLPVLRESDVSAVSESSLTLHLLLFMQNTCIPTFT